VQGKALIEHERAFAVAVNSSSEQGIGDRALGQIGLKARYMTEPVQEMSDDS
jgi:hypothetical protein